MRTTQQDPPGEALHRGIKAGAEVRGGTPPCSAGLGFCIDSSQKVQGQNIAPAEAQWRVGPNGIQVKDLRLAALEQVSTGSWQVRLFYKPSEC